MTDSTKKKLLVLDLNGLLVQRFSRVKELPKHRHLDGKLGKFFVYRRPYCNQFLAFCFKNFEVGIWSTAQEHNVQNLVDFIFGDLKSKLVFCWYQCHCTNTGLKTLENKGKPVVLKELHKLWDKLMPGLPWAKGDYGPFNTLLIDDTPYKAMRNPPHTAIFPYPYEVSNESDDILGGALLKYLEGISAATNVQDYVKCHRFGQPPISEECPHWDFYRKILFTRLPTVNRNCSYVLRKKMNGVANKTLTSITYNKCNGITQNSSIQEGSVPSIEREEKGVTKATKSKKKKKKSAMQAALLQEHEAHNISAVEKEKGRKRKPRKNKKKGAKQAALNKELGANNISVVDKDSAFGIPQRSDHDMVSNDDGLFETAVTGMSKRNGSIITTLSQQHATLNVPEEKEKESVAKATRRRKRKRKRVRQSALNGEHGVHHLSPADEEAAFGIPQPSDLDTISKDDGLFETAVNCTQERIGVIGTTFSQKHASLNGLEENGMAKAIRSKKEKRKSVMEAALSQEHGAHSIFPVEKEAGLAISQQSDLDIVSKEDGLAEIAVNCMTQRKGSSVTNLSQKYATLNGLEEGGAAKAGKHRRKKRKGAEQAALNQEPGARNISPVEKEAAFYFSQQSDLAPVSKEDVLPNITVTCMTQMNGSTVSTLSQKRATLNGLEESGAAKARKHWRKKRKGAEQAALNQEPGAHNISPWKKKQLLFSAI